MKYQNEEHASALLEQRRKRIQIRAAGVFSSFLGYINPKYELKWFHKLIADKCQSLYEGQIKNLMVFIPPQFGKALDTDTPILTANRGWIKHGDIVVGDYVFAPDGIPVLVQAVTHHYEWECRRVTFAQGSEIIASYNHEWGCYIPNRDHKSIFFPSIETDEIAKRRGDRSPYLQCAKPLYYPERELPIPPYLLGLWLGDGISANKRICKSIDDCKFFLSLYEGDLGKIDGNVAYTAFNQLNNTLLRQIGVLGNKHIPQMYLSSSINQRLSLLQGLMDTDGCSDRKCNCEISQTNKTMAEGIFDLVASLGYKPRLLVGDAMLKGRYISKKYRICFNPNRNDAVFLLPRKRERLLNKSQTDRGDKYKHFIKSIDNCGTRMVNCIQVEGGYYLVGRELRPTHNSEIISRSFPAWALGRNPDLKIVGSSYSSDLAEQFSRTIQRTIDSEEYRAVFPLTYLSGSGVAAAEARGYLRNVNLFETVGRKGFYKAVGVGGSLTGTPVDIAIIDDPVKDANEANSDVYRQRVWDWYNTVLTTRLHNKSKQLFIMTRWHEDDLAGRILKAEPQEWEVLSIPAICEVERDGGLSERHIGESLWEERHSIEKLLKQKQRAPREFNALYQQHPVIEGGNIVKRDWFGKMSFADFKALRFEETMHFYLDTAFNKKKKGADNDPSGILAACRIGKYIYIYDAKKMYKEMPDLLRFLPEYMAAHCGNSQSILHVEPKANGESVIQMLKEISTINVKRTPNPIDSKEVRFKAVSPRIECGRVIIVDGSWNEDFLDEVCGFPSAPHDEFVDILGYAINDLYDNDDDIDFDLIGNANII